MTGIVAVVNGWGTVPRVEAGEQEQPFPDPRELATLLPSTAAALRPPALVALADQLHPVFAATTPAQRVRRVALLLKDTGVRPTLTISADGVRADWVVDHVGTLCLRRPP